MKKVEAVIRPEKIYDVCEVLHDMGIRGMIMTETKCDDALIAWHSQIEQHETCNAPQMKLVLTVPNSLLQPVLFVIVNEARIGSGGDGRIIVSSIEKVIQVEDEEIDESMLCWYQLTKYRGYH
ncbi:MAG: P-II family nitrogen regulator [Candidatus Kryptoniota bacterium]